MPLYICRLLVLIQIEDEIAQEECQSYLVSRSCQYLSVWRDFQGVDLRVCVLESPDAFPGVGLPKLDGVVVAGSGKDHLKGEGQVKTTEH